MNKFFVALRLLAYVAIFGTFCILSHSIHRLGDWIITIIVIGWGTWDLWKKPDDTVASMRIGVWIEMISVSLWVALLQGHILLFAFISPLLRTSVHLRWGDRIFVFVIAVAEVILFSWWLPGTDSWIPIIVFMTLTLYGSIISEFINEKEKARRLVALSGFEKEQMAREQERVKMSRQLHDTMGQYWIAVIRAMDVAVSLNTLEKESYIMKARDVAEEGLKEMRRSIHQWNEGKQTPEQWIEWTIASVERLKELTKVDIQFQRVKIEWNRFIHPIEISEFISRAILESLTNAIRHGISSKILIFFQLEDTKLSVTIRDNGKGFSLTKNKDIQNGIGIASMRENAKEIGAELQIESTNYGSTIHFSIPYQR